MCLKYLFEEYSIANKIEGTIDHYNYLMCLEINKITDRKEAPFIEHNLKKSIIFSALISFIIAVFAHYVFNLDYFLTALIFICPIPFLVILIVSVMNNKNIVQAKAQGLIDDNAIFKEAESIVGSNEQYLRKSLVESFLIKNNLFTEPRKLIVEALQEGMVDKINITEFNNKLKISKQSPYDFVFALNDQAVKFLHKEIIKKLESKMQEKIDQHYFDIQKRADEMVQKERQLKEERKLQEALAIQRTEENSTFILSKFSKNLAV